MHSPLEADEPSRSTVLVVDDDSTVRSVVVDYLKASEYDVTEVGGQVQARTSSIDSLLDEIDSVLETNAEAFVQGFVQKGGQ